MNLNKKCFNNPICKKCHKDQIKKYGIFQVLCDGITVEDDVSMALKEGLDEHTARMMFDPIYYFESIYGSKARHYQKKLLLCTSKNLVGRQCRQTGKTLVFMYKIFHYVATNDNKTVLVVTPRETQIKKIWDEYIFRDWYFKNSDVKESIGKNYSQSPYYHVKLDNGSRIILMIAGPGARSATADTIYMDEAALIPAEELNAIMGTILSRGDDSTIYMTSTPKGRGNMFYDSCMTDPDFIESHISIYDVEEMKSQIPRFKKILGTLGFAQECEAIFPSASGGPFNYEGIDLAQKEYDYDSCVKQQGLIYIGGVDWNGPNVGTYFYVISFNPDTYNIQVVDKKVVASDIWNATVAKQTLIELNRKWSPKNWMTDFGYGHCLKLSSISTNYGIKLIEDIKIGDLVLTHDGTYKPVVNIYKPNIKKNVYTLHPNYHIGVHASEDHRFLIKELSNRKNTKQKDLIKQPIWKKVKDIDIKSDYICIPKIKYNKNKYKIIDMYEFLKNDIKDLKFDDIHIWLEKSPLIKLNRFIDILDKDFLKFVGFYIAEGNLSHKSIELTQYESNLEKSEFYNIVGKFSKITNLEYAIYKTEIDTNNLGIVKKTNNKYKYRAFFFGQIINKLMYKLCGSISDTKVIHNTLMENANKLMPLVDGLFLGDGHLDKKGYYSLSTTSRSILYQAREILLANGKMPSASEIKSNQNFKYKYNLKYKTHKSKVSLYLEDNKYFYVPIRSIKFKEITDELVDIEVEGNHSFLSNGFITHNSTNEELRYWSTFSLPLDVPANHPDAMLKHTLEPTNFGEWVEIEDPFTKEKIKKTCKSFIISQVSKLFEPENGYVPFSYSQDDIELTKSLENYKLLTTTDKGVEKYGFEKNSGLEDHCLDSLSLAIYGIVKNYSDLFKQIFLYSVPINGKEILSPTRDDGLGVKVPSGASIILLTNNSPDPIHLDEKAWKEPIEDNPLISRSFSRGAERTSNFSQSMMYKRNRNLISRSID